MTLSVPKSAHSGLKILASLDDQAIELLVGTLQQTIPTASSTKLAADVASQIAEIPSSKVQAVVRSLVTLHIGREFLQIDLPRFSREVCESLSEVEEFASILDRVQSVLCHRLERFLQMVHPLGVTSKAIQILTDHEHVFYGAKVLTDVRFVFGTDVTERPDGALIMHIMSIHHHDGGEHKETFFALDDEDIENLAEVLERAKKKSRTLRGVLDGTQVPYLGVK